ncbi:MAG: PSD1 and planctomycete cytochrome C domain-containing protein, partial [Planctomyces sp.]
IAAILVSSNCTVEGDTFFADEAAPEFFERRIRPLLADSCLKCHGPEKQWAGLRLDSRDAILAGGESGPAVIPGDPEGSLLIRAVRHADDAPKMPEEGQLSESQIRDLEAWVKSGAFFPNSDSGNQRSRDPNHWAFQPPVRPILPEVKSRERIQTDMDLFIQEKLEAAGLTLSEPADRQTLLRRVTYDLTGLPPTPEEVAAFRDDAGADAWSKVVDRLLDSPAYGERWGRRWLDVVRYADSNGLDENIAHGNAWRYRDYVVNSFNADKPFDRIIHEQIAGDLIPADSDSIRQEQLIATGFLSIGPKVLAEVNQPKMRMDIVDEQIDTVGRVFLGMTFGCARCHDHKFDPIETEDYYGLAGIFRSTKTMDSYTKVARWHEHPLATEDAFYQAQKKQHDADVSAKKQQVEKIIADAVAALAASGNALSEPSADAEGRFPESVRMELAKLREALAKLEKEPPESPSAMGVTEDEVADTAVHVRGNPLKLGDTVVRHVPVVMKGPQLPEFSSKQSGRKELAAWLTDAKNPLTSRVIVNRVWRWHFGQGIVRSTENFGIPGERPSHPELLDWLALHFVDKGWSMKSLHRLILNS